MKITIAGGGLVGALSACVFGQKGHEIELVEFRPDPQSSEGRVVRGRSINLALSTRGRATLAKAGLESRVLEKAIPMKGRMLHALDGSTKEVLYDPTGNHCIWSVSRRYLNDMLLQEAANLPNVNVRFNHKVIQADLDSGLLNVRDEKNGTDLTLSADILIGADGAHSTIRRSMLKRPLTNFSQTYIEHGYMELCIPATEDGQHAMAKNYLHIWPRNQFMLIALPNQDGSFTATLFMPFEIFSKLTSAELIQDFFAVEFPDALYLIGKDLLVEDFLTSSPSPLISVKCSPLNAGRTVLIGDAAHAMVPFYGQGMNAGFEDVLLLDQLLSEITATQEVERSLAKFSNKRIADAQAICELAMYNYVEMRSHVNKRGYYLRRLADYSLNKILGNRWVPLYNAVTFSQMPYANCVQHRERQDEVLAAATRYASIAFTGCVIASLAYWRREIPGFEQLSIK